MRFRALAVGFVIMFAAGVGAAEDFVVPAFAFNLPGHGKNLWTSEIYLANPTDRPVLVETPVVLEGRLVVPRPCLPPIRQLEVPAASSVVWKAEDIAVDLGCAQEIVGALMFRADGPLAVSSRMINRGGLETTMALTLLSGFSQELPGLAVPALPSFGTTYMLPSLVWHRNSCGAVAFDTYVGLANPGDEDVNVTLFLAPGSDDTAMYVDGKLMELPAILKVPARGWRQVHLQPVDSMLAVCLEPERFDLFVTVDGPTALYGSVVDRATQDPRTVMPVALEGSKE